MKNLYQAGAGALLGVCLGGCAPGGALDTKTQLGGAQDTVGEQTETQLVKCAQPLGTAALVEEEDPGLAQVGLPSPVPLLRLMMSRSNCFQVVDRGQAGELMRRERELMAEGQLEGGTGPAAGQMVAAQYLLTPHVVFQDTDAGGGGLGAALGALLPGVAGLLAGGIKTENLEAQTVLTLTNVGTGLQESVAEGSARKRDVSFALGGLGFGGSAALGAVGGAYASTDIGKLVSAAFLDAYNKLVESVEGSGS